MSSSNNPQTKQNNLIGESTEEPIRHQTTINERAGSIEFVNTENQESLTIISKHGQSVKFDKFNTTINSSTPMITNVMGDSEINVTGSLIVGAENVDFLGKDSFKKLGSIDKEIKYSEQQLKDYQDKVHTKYKRLFEIKRVRVHNSIDQSPLQTKKGSLAQCASHLQTTKHLYIATPRIWEQSKKIDCDITPGVLKNNVSSILLSVGGRVLEDRCFTCYGDLLSPSTQDGKWDKETLKNEITKLIVDLTEPLALSEKKQGSSKNPAGGNNIEYIGKNVAQQVGLAFNTSESFRKDPKGKLVPYGIKIDPLGNAVYKQYREAPLIEKVHVDTIAGGHYSLNACDSYNLSVGANGINIKTNGDIYLYGINNSIIGESILINSSSEIIIGSERVDISGEIITLRPNKVERPIEDASGSYKSLPANGKQITEPEQQVFIDGNLNVGMNAIIAGGMHVEGELTLQHITAPLEYQITETDFEWREESTITGLGCPVGQNDSNVLVDENELVESKSSISKTATHADLLGGHWIGNGPSKDIPLYGTCSCGATCVVTLPACVVDVISKCAPSSIQVHPHYHYFKNLPLQLMGENPLNGQSIDQESIVGAVTHAGSVDSHQAVRAIGSRNNMATLVTAKPIVDSEHNYSVMNKFSE